MTTDEPMFGTVPRISKEPLPPQITKTDRLTEPLVHTAGDMMVILPKVMEDPPNSPEGGPWHDMYCGMCGDRLGVSLDPQDRSLIEAHWPDSCRANVDLNA